MRSAAERAFANASLLLRTPSGKRTISRPSSTRTLSASASSRVPLPSSTARRRSSPSASSSAASSPPSPPSSSRNTTTTTPQRSRRSTTSHPLPPLSTRPYSRAATLRTRSNRPTRAPSTSTTSTASFLPRASGSIPSPDPSSVGSRRSFPTSRSRMGSRRCLTPSRGCWHRGTDSASS